MFGNQPPNIILLILDAVRAKSVSAYGYAAGTTPHLYAFAKTSVLFQHAFTSATWTIPTHASLLSGLYLSQHRIETINADRRFNEAIVPLPTALGRNGYRTSAFSSNLLFSPKHHFQGFDEFYEFDALMETHRLTHALEKASRYSSGSIQKVVRYIRKSMSPRVLLNAVSQWAERQGDRREPFFMAVNLASVHYPWAVPLGVLARNLRFSPHLLLKSEYSNPSPYLFNSGRLAVSAAHQRVWQRMYRAALMHTDREVGRLLQRIGQLDNTIIIVTADHGEMLGEHRGIVGHMLSLHDNIMRIPLIIRHPGFPAGLRVQGVVQNLDLYPSILEWAGVAPDTVPAAQMQRPSLSQAMMAPHARGGYAFAEEDFTDSYSVLQGLQDANPTMSPDKYPKQQIAVRSATHKFVWCGDQIDEFYNLITDPEEERNLIDTANTQEAAELGKLHEALQSWQSRLVCFPPQAAAREFNMDEALTARLRALGYVA